MKRYTWRTHAAERPAPGTVTIHFDTGGAPFYYLPGQFVNLTVQVGGTALSRSYSLSSAPGVDERPAVTVKAVDGGVVSNHLVAHAETIESWQVEGPFGNFTMPTGAENDDAPVFLIAGGSGITPLWSIAKSLLYGTERQVCLVYGSRNAGSVIFGDELRAYQALFKERFSVVHVLSQPGAKPHGYDDALSGRLTAASLSNVLEEQAGGAATNVFYFLCGPTGLIETARQVLRTLSVEDARVFTEHFGAAPSETPEVAGTETYEVLLHAADHSSLVAVPPGVSLLDAALAERIPLRYSCKTGTCGSCIGRALSGRVYMAHNAALTASDVAAGYVLLCQCHPTDDAVTIEADAEWTMIFER